MDNPFKITDDQIQTLFESFTSWQKSNPIELTYADKFREQAETIRLEFLNEEILDNYKDDELYKKIYSYSRSLEGPAYIRLGESRIKSALPMLRRSLKYIIKSEVQPFIVAQEILSGEYRIELFAKAFWSPILQARFPENLPNWNNKTERFLKSVGINISTSKLTVSEKYEILSDSFKYIGSLVGEEDFYLINHLMHYGTEVEEGVGLLKEYSPNEKDPVADMIQQYKAKIKEKGLDDELYKWQLTKKFHHRPNTEAENFLPEYKSIDYSNMLYHNAKGVGNHLSEEREEKFSEQFRYLFDENIDLQSRVSRFTKETFAIYKEIRTNETDSHHQDERTISTYLAYYDANSYPFYKDSFYRKYCRLVGEKIKPTGNKYLHYIQLLDELIDNYIEPDQELLELKAKYIPKDGHKDSSHYILAQDILYQMLDQKASEEAKYWVYAPGENAESWEEFYEAGIMGLGWDRLGDLNNYATKNDIVKRLQEIEDTNSSKKNDATANFEFKEIISIGDVVIVKKGRSELLGYGRVASDYYFDESRERYQKCRKVDWKLKGNWVQHHSLPVKTLTDVTRYDTIEPDYEKYYEYLMSVMSDIEDSVQDPEIEFMKSKPMNLSLNTILYGPPGTGKTYHTVDLAVKIADPLSYRNDDHAANKEIYDKLVNQGQVIFTTFHQSMCYEDFVEGIKPEPPSEESDHLTYDIQDGIFKKIATHALFEHVGQANRKDLSGTYTFNAAFSNYSNVVKEALDNSNEVWIKTRSGSEIEIIDINDRENFSVKHKDKENVYLVSKKRLEKLYTSIEDIHSIGNINEVIRSVIGGCNSSAYWAILNELQKVEVTESTPTTPQKIDYESKKLAISKLKASDILLDDPSVKNYLLVIDEINRGNVSQILGELITLIEEDKRFGREEGIEIMLPYSKDRFLVPPNLYIIGTMNTADRSVEALDTALRRRFSFVEMMPVYDLPQLTKEIEGFALSSLLEVLNFRIEKILDRDHQIGHSYFLEVDDIEGLQKAFYDKIIPLLQEYFYNDYEKMGLILGMGFVGKNGRDNQGFAEFPVEDPDVFERPIYELKKEPTQSANAFLEALKTLLNNKEK